MEAKDPFASISELCHISPSQEDCLLLCSFAHEPEDSDEDDGFEDSREIPTESTGIIMVSPPESSASDSPNDDNAPHDTDIFRKPPEGSLLASSDDHPDNTTVVVEEETAGGCTEGVETVDLGAATDLGFSEVELTHRIDSENEVILCESDRVRDLKRELAIKDSLSESQLKKRKALDDNFGLESPNHCLRAELEESRDGLNSNVSPYNCGTKSLQNDNPSEIFRGSNTRRKLHFSTEVLELETEATDEVLGFSEGLEDNTINYEGVRLKCNSVDGERNRNFGRKSIEDFDKYRYVGPSVDSAQEMVRKRTLPVSVCGQADNIRKELDSGENVKKITLLDVLRMLAERAGYDRNLENKSILDVAKSRGITFP